MTTLRKAARNVVDVWNRYGTAESLRGWMEILEAVLAESEQCERCGKVTRPDDIHTCTPRRLTDDEIGQIWFQARIPGLTKTAARLLIRAAEQWRTPR